VNFRSSMLAHSLTDIGSCFISNPKSQFNEHIDAPVEVEVAYAQDAAEKKRYNSA
jgi:hypothetical protein